MLQHRLLAELAQRLTEHRRVLLDDAGEGNDIDDASQAMTDGMVQREGQRRQRLAPSGRHRQREQPRRAFRLLAHMGQDVGADAVDWRIGAEAGQMLIQSCAQFAQCWRLAGTQRWALLDTVVEGFGIEKVGIDQAGKQHAGQKGLLENDALPAPGDGW